MGNDVRKTIGVLSRATSEQWFRRMRNHLVAEDLWAVVKTPHRLTVPTPISTANTPTSSAGTTPSIIIGSGDDKSNAKATLHLTLCLDENDEEDVAHMSTAFAIWAYLNNKYQEKLQTTGHQYLVDYITYKKPVDLSIEDALTYLKKLSRKIIGTQKGMHDLSTDRRLLSALLNSLPEEYMVIKDAIEAQKDPNLDLAIQKLLEKEAQLKAQETAMWAERNKKAKYRTDRSTSRRPRRSSSSGSNRSRNGRPSTAECFLCLKNHFVRDCPHLPYAQKKVQMRSNNKKHDSHKHKAPKPKPKHRAYNAEDNSSSGESPSDSSESEESVGDELAALSKEVVSKICDDDWVADTGASSHMTDTLRHFRGPLTTIPRRTIRVGGGKLYSSQRGTVRMYAKDGNKARLAEALYVPGLGVNLLSGRRMCQKGFHGGFNKNKMWMQNKEGKRVLIAKQQGGVYIVDQIAPQELALLAVKQSKSQAAFPAVDQELQMDEQADVQANCTDETDNSKSAKAKRYTLWHRRFAHLGSAKLRKLHEVTTLQKPVPIVEDSTNPCEVCALTKICNKRNHHVSERKASILALVSIDICGPLPISRQGYQYFLEIIDNYSRRTWTIPLIHREDAPEALRKWKTQTELQSGVKLLAIRSDNGPELKSILDQWCSSIGIIPNYTLSYNSLQNGLAERGIRTTENSIRAMLKEAELPLEFWPEAGQTDAYLRNRVATGPLVDGKLTSPIEAFTGVKPSIDHLRVWGCKCYSYVDVRSMPMGERHDKLVDRGRVGVFLGYVDETNAFVKIWAPDLGKVIRHNVVRFAEDQKGGHIDLKMRVKTINVLPERRPVGRPRKAAAVPGSINPIGASSSQANKEADEPLFRSEAKSAPDAVSPDVQTDDPNVASSDNEIHGAIDPPDEIQQPKPASERKVQTFLHVAIPKRKRDDYDDAAEHRDKIVRAMAAFIAQDITGEAMDDEYGFAAIGEGGLTNKLVIPVPVSWKDAINDPVWGELWKEAIKAELIALAANGTWEVVTPPTNANIVTSKWVFKAKMHIDGTLDKLKARLVARGFSQAYGVDYEDTFAPTVKFDTLRVFLVIVMLEDLECHQVDVNNAFTESFLKQKIYMAPPPGVDVPPGQCLRILRSLYGLKQAARDWHERCVKELATLGFKQCDADPCLLFHPVRRILLLLYVDDIGVAAQTMENVNWFKNEFQKVFKVKDLGEMKKILGIRITRDRKNRTLRMDQSHYLNEVLDRLHMPASKHNPVELPMNGYDSLRPAGPHDQRIDQREYQHAIGSIMYAAIHTRPDIAFAVGRLSQYLADPAKHHGQALKTLLKYLRSTVNKGLMYRSNGSPHLIGYSDSDYAADRVNRKSILGYAYAIGGSVVAWMSRKQKSVATSTTEAEYMALSSCAKEGLWISQLFKDIGYSKYLGDPLNRVGIVENVKHKGSSSTQLMGDNQAALALVKDAHIHERSKHIDVAYHHVRDLHKSNRIRVDYVPSADMIADGLTKPLTKEKFKAFVDQLGLQDMEDSGSHRRRPQTISGS